MRQAKIHSWPFSVFQYSPHTDHLPYGWDYHLFGGQVGIVRSVFLLLFFLQCYLKCLRFHCFGRTVSHYTRVLTKRFYVFFCPQVMCTGRTAWRSVVSSILLSWIDFHCGTFSGFLTAEPSVGFSLRNLQWDFHCGTFSGIFTARWSSAVRLPQWEFRTELHFLNHASIRFGTVYPLPDIPGKGLTTSD